MVGDWAQLSAVDADGVFGPVRDRDNWCPSSPGFAGPTIRPNVPPPSDYARRLDHTPAITTPAALAPRPVEQHVTRDL